MERKYLYQVDIREWIENGLDAEIMVVMCQDLAQNKMRSSAN